MLSVATILEKIGVEDAPFTFNGHGVRLFSPDESLRENIGPITVKDTAEVVEGSNGSEFVMQVVHCLPTPCGFVEPLELDFVIGDGDGESSNRANISEGILREYQVRIT